MSDIPGAHNRLWHPELAKRDEKVKPTLPDFAMSEAIDQAHSDEKVKPKSEPWVPVTGRSKTKHTKRGRVLVLELEHPPGADE